MSRSSRKKTEQYQKFKDNLRAAYTDIDESLGPPDFSFLESVPRSAPTAGGRKYGVPVRIAAAAVLAVVFGFGSFFTVDAVGRRTAIREEASRFVETLFDQPLFDQESTGFDGTLVDYDILSDLVLPLPQTENLPETL